MSEFNMLAVANLASRLIVVKGVSAKSGKPYAFVKFNERTNKDGSKRSDGFDDVAVESAIALGAKVFEVKPKA